MFLLTAPRHLTTDLQTFFFQVFEGGLTIVAIRSLPVPVPVVVLGDRVDGTNVLDSATVCVGKHRITITY